MRRGNLIHIGNAKLFVFDVQLPFVSFDSRKGALLLFNVSLVVVYYTYYIFAYGSIQTATL